MRIMGLDYGDKTIGVAVSDPFGWTAQGLEVIRRPNPIDLKESLVRLGQIIKEYGVEQIVLGYPKNMDNSEGERCMLTREFERRLNETFPGIPVILQDERMSSVFSERAMLEGDLKRDKRKALVDIGAAVFILQGYLDGIVRNK